MRKLEFMPLLAYKFEKRHPGVYRAIAAITVILEHPGGSYWTRAELELEPNQISEVGVNMKNFIC